MSLKPLTAPILFLFFSAALSAASVNIAVFQKTALSGENAQVGEATRIIENTIMDYYFEKGFIISNERTSTDWEAYKDEETGLQQAKAGYAEYFVAVLIPLETTVQPVNMKYIRPVSWRVVRTADGAVLAQGESVPGALKDNPQGSSPSGSKQTEQDPVKGIGIFAAGIAQDTIDVIQKSR
ncbi:MAG: hypothetical protein LBU99_02155 [Spirochaetaceae bacterium]|jgi:hypothetical protein|nr:hypothetical protein [Spirochaetaceae bacterium]